MRQKKRKKLLEKKVMYCYKENHKRTINPSKGYREVIFDDISQIAYEWIFKG